MSEPLLQRLASGRCQVEGVLSFETVPELVKNSQSLFAGEGDIELDLARVEHSDSAGLALLLEWVRVARSQKRKISFVNIPEQLSGLARVGGVESLLEGAV